MSQLITKHGLESADINRLYSARIVLENYRDAIGSILESEDFTFEHSKWNSHYLDEVIQAIEVLDCENLVYPEACEATA